MKTKKTALCQLKLIGDQILRANFNGLTDKKVKELQEQKEEAVTPQKDSTDKQEVKVENKEIEEKPKKTTKKHEKNLISEIKEKREERKAKNSQNKNEEEKTGEKPKRKKSSKKKDEVASEISSSDKPNTVVGNQEKLNIEKVEENKKDVAKTTEDEGESESTAKQVIRKMRGEKVNKPDSKKENK